MTKKETKRKERNASPASKILPSSEAAPSSTPSAHPPSNASPQAKPRLFAHLFHRRSLTGAATKTDARKAARKSETLERTARQKHGAKRARKERKHRDAQYRKRMLANLLVQAGYDTQAEQLRKTVFYLTTSIVGGFTFVSLVIAAFAGKSAGDLLLFYLGVWTAVFAAIYLFIWMVIYVFLDLRIYRRTRQLEEVLPDFLQLASANISAGMPIDRALWFAVRPNFGVLAKEIEEVAKATLTGEELAQSLMDFTERYDSAVLRRSVNILLEGMAAGGEIADLLNKIAIDIQETKILRKEMGANVATYAIFITFASIVMAPVLFGLATELLTIIVRITGAMDLSATSSNFLTLNIKTTPEMISNFRWFSVAMLSISALMSASIVSIIRKGRIKEGIRNLPIFLAVSLIIYLITASLLHGMLGSLI